MSLKEFLSKSVNDGIGINLIKPGGRIKNQLIDMMTDLVENYNAGLISLKNKIIGYPYYDSLDEIINKYQSDQLILYIENIDVYLLVAISNFTIFLDNILPEDVENYECKILPGNLVLYEIILENIPQYAIFYYKNVNTKYIDQIKRILFDKIKVVTFERNFDNLSSQLVTNIQINDHHEGVLLIEHINKLLGKSSINLSKILYTMPPLLTNSMKYKYTMNKMPIIPYNDIKHAAKFMITANTYNAEESVICVGNGNFTVYKNNHNNTPNDIITRTKETVDKWTTDNPPGSDESLKAYFTRLSKANRGLKLSYSILNEIMFAKGYKRVKPETHYVWRYL